jgi:hypothetical protein
VKAKAKLGKLRPVRAHAANAKKPKRQRAVKPKVARTKRVAPPARAKAPPKKAKLAQPPQKPEQPKAAGPPEKPAPEPGNGKTK